MDLSEQKHMIHMGTNDKHNRIFLSVPYCRTSNVEKCIQSVRLLIFIKAIFIVKLIVLETLLKNRKRLKKFT